MRIGILLLAPAFVACGGTMDPPSPGNAGASGTGGGSNGAGSGGSGSLMNGGSAGALGGGANAGGANAGGANAGANGVPLLEQPLVPLIPGHLSSFAFSPIDKKKPMTDICPNPTTAVESGAGRSFDGHMGTLYRTFCATEPFLLEGQADDLTGYELKDGKLVLPSFAYIHSPVADGEMWDSGSGDKYTWQAVTAPIETPAGTFEACWDRQGSDTRITYCRGVGVVQALGTYGNYQLDLVKKNF